MKDEFEIKFKSGSCPGGWITLKPGNNYLCNLHIRAGYHDMYESSIDLDHRTARKLIGYLEGLIKGNESTLRDK